MWTGDLHFLTDEMSEMNVSRNLGTKMSNKMPQERKSWGRERLSANWVLKTFF